MRIRLPRRLWTRLTVLFVGLFVITIGVVVVLSLVIANEQFSRSVDDQIQSTALTVEQRLAEGNDPQRTLDQLATASQFLEILDAEGATSYRSFNLLSFTLPSFLRSGEVRTSDGFHTISRRGSVIRLVRHATLDESGNVVRYIVVGGAVAGTGDSTFDLGLIVVPTAAAGLLIVALGTIWLSRREAAPLRRLADEVRTTAATGFEKPIAAAGQGSEEAQELRQAFSTLVDRQRDLIARERAFFADSSHVLRTPLAVLRGDIEMLEQGVYGKERQEAVAQARSAIDSMSRTISGLLLLAREQDGAGSSWEVVDLVPLVRGIVADAALITPDVTVTIVEAPTTAEVAGDPSQLRDLFISLVENACHYTPAGGSVQVAIAWDGGEVEVSIRDSGIGFGDEELSRARDRFFRGAQARRMRPGGSGLGLAIADRIVSLHRGELRLERNEPLGAAVTVRLPGLE